MTTCWIALDPTAAVGGTVEFARGSQQWSTDNDPPTQFHALGDYRDPVETAADAEGVALDIVPIEVPAGGSFHHGWTWHGSGPNQSDTHRRALVLHCASSEARFHPPGVGEGNGPIYSRYARPDVDDMDEAHFPVLWRYDGYRTPGLAGDTESANPQP